LAATGAAPAAAITDLLTAQFADGAATAETSPLRRLLFPENGKGVGACDEEEVVEGRKVGDARTWSIAAPARGALFLLSGGVWLAFV